MKTIVQKTLEDIESFLALTGMKERHFGLQAVHDHKLIEQMRKPNCILKSSTIDKINDFIKTNQPKGLKNA